MDRDKMAKIIGACIICVSIVYGIALILEFVN